MLHMAVNFPTNMNCNNKKTDEIAVAACCESFSMETWRVTRSERLFISVVTVMCFITGKERVAVLLFHPSML